MKYKLLKDLPLAKAGTEVELSTIGDTNFSLISFLNHFNQKMNAGEIMNKNIPEWLEPIIEKNRYEDLKRNDMIFEIEYDGIVYKSHFELDSCRSETFLTREEAGDEHKRREWAVRADKFIPKEGEQYFVPGKKGVEAWDMTNSFIDIVFINSGLAFRTREECEQAIREHDIVRLFYSIR